MGAAAYGILREHADFASGECLLELGSERGEGSTLFFADFCEDRDVVFHTVDIDPNVYKRAAAMLNKRQRCHAHLALGEDFMANTLTEKVRFAYLDSFDCIPAGFEEEPFVAFYADRYRELGMEMTNENSETAHLNQARLVDEHAASRCTILIDDTARNGSRWVGKGALAMPYLKTAGYTVSDLGGAGLAVKK